jgi:hypothetical protein
VDIEPAVQHSDDLVAFPASGFGVRKALARMRLLRVPVLADEWVGILFLIEVAEGVIDFAMLAFICTNYCSVSRSCRIRDEEYVL